MDVAADLKRKRMYRDEIYHQIAREFSTGVGVATAVRVTDIAEAPRVERSPEERMLYRHAQDQWRVNRIITDAVRTGRYPALTRRVFWSRRTNPDWSERRHYTMAWGDLAGRKRKEKKSKTG